MSTTKYRSRTGEVKSKEQWDGDLNRFWATFESSYNCGGFGDQLPRRPADAWERFVKVMKLEEV